MSRRCSAVQHLTQVHLCKPAMYSTRAIVMARNLTQFHSSRIPSDATCFSQLAVMAPPNLFTLAADGDCDKLIPLLRENPAFASSQDDHGYSLVHAAASYGHLDLLRQLIRDFHVDVNLKDEDDETALFQVELVEVAQALCEELGADVTLRNTDGMSAAEAIENEGDRPLVSAYLREVTGQQAASATAGGASANGTTVSNHTGAHAPPRLLPDMSINVGTMEAPGEVVDGVDPELRRRIEHLASRPDFQDEEGQAELKKLITDIVHGHVIEGGEGRDVKRRTE